MPNTEISKCSACGAPLDAPSHGGRIECAYCHAVNMVIPQEKKMWDGIQCPKCGTDNPREALHCRHCGSELKFSCPGCGALNPYGTTHCMRCGVDIQAEVKRREEEARLREEAMRQAQEEARLREEATQRRQEEIARLEQEQARRQLEEVKKKEQRRRRSTNLIIFGVMGVVLIFIVPLLGNKIYKANFSPQALQTKTAFAAWQTAMRQASTKQAIANQTATAEYRILFHDDFSKPSTGWDVIHNEDGSASFEDGAYHMRVTTDSLLWAKLSNDFQSNVSIEVDATRLNGSEDTYFGFLCRYQDIDNFYMFIVRIDGNAIIGRQLQGKTTFISSDEEAWIPVDNVLTGSSTNHIRTDCVGNELTLYVNGAKVAHATDDSLQTGKQVGLIAGTSGTSKAEIQFDNFYVYRP